MFNQMTWVKIYICMYISVYKQARKITYQAFFTMSEQLCIKIYKRQDLNDNSNRDNLLQLVLHGAVAMEGALLMKGRKDQWKEQDAKVG